MVYIMDTEGPISVLDRRSRSTSRDRVIMDRLTRQRSSGASRRRRSGCRSLSSGGSASDEDEEEEVIYRIPQPYRTSLSAMNSVTWGRSGRNQTTSLNTSLRSDHSAAQRRFKSPKHVTYNPKVSVRLSDTEDSVFTDLSSFELDDEEEDPPLKPVTSRFSRRLISPKYNEFSDPSLFPAAQRNIAESPDSGFKFRDVSNLSNSFSADTQSSMSRDSGLDYSAQLRDISDKITSMQWSPRLVHSPPATLDCWQMKHVPAAATVIPDETHQLVTNARCDNTPLSQSSIEGIDNTLVALPPASDKETRQSSWGSEANSSWTEHIQDQDNPPRGSFRKHDCDTSPTSQDVEDCDHHKGCDTITRDYVHKQTISCTKALQGDYGPDIQRTALEAQMEEQQLNVSDNASSDHSYVYLTAVPGSTAENENSAPSKRSISHSISKFLKRVSPSFKHSRTKDHDSKSSSLESSSIHHQDHSKNNGYYNPHPPDSDGSEKVKHGSQFSRSRVGQSLRKLVKKSSSGSKKRKKKSPEVNPSHYTIEVRDSNIHTSYLDLRDTVDGGNNVLKEDSLKVDKQPGSEQQDSSGKGNPHTGLQEWGPYNGAGSVTVSPQFELCRPDATSSPTMYSHHERMEFFTDSNISAILQSPSEKSTFKTSIFRDYRVHDPGGFDHPKLMPQEVMPVVREPVILLPVGNRVSANERIGSCSLDIKIKGSEPSLVNGNGLSEDTRRGNSPGSLIRTVEGQSSSEGVRKGTQYNKENSRPRDTASSISKSGPPSPVDPSYKPSYLKLSCAVSGYGKYSYYNTYRDVAQRSLSSGHISARSYLKSSDHSMPGGQMPRSVSSSEHMKGPKVTGWSSSQDVSSRHAESPVITVNGHISENALDSVKKNGEHFLQCMSMEESRLKDLCSQAEADMRSHDLPEEASGRMRAAIGKANLLLSQKFVQFMELCHNHMKPNPDERETKWEDLQGFWDIVKIQIDNVDDMFAEIELMRQNGWQEVTRMPSRRSSTSSSPQSGSISQSSTPAATPSHTPGSRRKTLAANISKDTPESSPERTQKARQAAKARDEARKKMLLEKRAAMKQATAATGKDATVEIYIPEQGEK